MTTDNQTLNLEAKSSFFEPLEKLYNGFKNRPRVLFTGIGSKKIVIINTRGDSVHRVKLSGIKSMSYVLEKGKHVIKIKNNDLPDHVINFDSEKDCLKVIKKFQNKTKPLTFKLIKLTIVLLVVYQILDSIESEWVFGPMETKAVSTAESKKEAKPVKIEIEKEPVKEISLEEDFGLPAEPFAD